MTNSITYEEAGVNIKAGDKLVQTIKPLVKNTYTPEVIGGIGHFAGLYDLSTLPDHYQHPIMAQSIDGVGTKAIVAKMSGCYDYLGIDLLSACSNDLLVLGATTLTLLDYIACDVLNPTIAEDFIKGLAISCKKHNVALVGGETAEMPGTYRAQEFDFVGIATGVVEKEKIITGSKIKENDLILGFSSTGLHTNGYSLARKLLFDIAGYKINQYVDDLQETVADSLLKPHLNYNPPIQLMLSENISIHGMAHITGGGLLGNIPRVLPNHTAALLDNYKQFVTPLFKLLTSIGKLSPEECYKTFNMGIGFIVIIPPIELPAVEQALKIFHDYPYQVIGHITAGQQEVILQ